MIVYVNRKPKFGPWGGGAKTLNKLVEHLQHRGHQVVYELKTGIDIIFCFDPRPNDRGEWYQNFIDYRSQYPKTKIIQRIGDLGTHSKPHLTNLIKNCIGLSDFLIFPSQWAKDWIGFVSSNGVVIDNAPMPIFYSNRKIDHSLKDQVNIVTHHWSTNPKKGFDTYVKFDDWCKDKDYNFYYVGQVPGNLNLTNYIKPVSSGALSSLLPSFDIYLTASEEEAGANHVLEAMACGLPVLYKDTGGSIPNYCKGYGESYSNFKDMLNKLEKITKEYNTYKSDVLKYSNSNDQVVKQYCDIIESYES